MSTTIGCGTESGVKYCADNCVYSGSDSDCLDYRIRNMKIIIGDREIMEPKIKLAFIYRTTFFGGCE